MGGGRQVVNLEGPLAFLIPSLEVDIGWNPWMQLPGSVPCLVHLKPIRFASMNETNLDWPRYLLLQLDSKGSRLD